MGRTLRGLLAGLIAAGLATCLAGCIGKPSKVQPETASLTGNASERDCMVRAMYFESNRSSHDGLMAVGTVVMNRVESPRHPNTVCGVVSEHRQFAQGVMTRPLDPRQVKPAERAADAVLKGERYVPVGKSMHFHVAGYNNPYPAKYVAVAGGNAFYLRPGQRLREKVVASRAPEVTTASASPAAASAAVQTANATAAPDASFLDRLYSRVATATPPKGSCDTIAAGFGATSLACESETAGR